ncbi:uncharacterized protein [Engystomops pustulosus]|uniref:uncharacterized protein n=1 Tax=Engystomops pustulosus TaxID=76066 RepID=UPI003AFA2902
MERPLLSESLAQVTFDDAAIYFSEEQWQNLEDVQKKIYKDLIKEIYETMLALGYRIPKPEIVSRIERGEEPCVDPCKKPKLQESQPEGAPDGSKDSRPEIKAERESPKASTPVAPGEISSSQERGGALCARCGTCCNNQCRMGYQWNTQGMYPGSPMDVNPGKPYMTPPSNYFNGSPISPGYAGRGEGMSHPTSPIATYGNSGMVPLSPHYLSQGYRNAADPTSPFQVPERPGNPAFGYEQMPMGPPGSHVDLENRNRNLHMVHHDRRNPLPPCPGCGTYCNNQCGMNVHWDQRRLHHPIPGPVDMAPAHRYTSPPNPYFSGGGNPAAYSNIRPPVRHGTPPVNVQGNPGMIQISAPYPGYRRPGDAKSPNVFPNKPDHSAGNVMPGNSAAASSPHGSNQSVKYGTVPANNGGNHRKSQSMSPLAAIETMPLFAAGNSPGADQRGRPLPQIVTSSDNSRNMPTYNNGRQQPQQQNYTVHGNKMTRVQPATSATGNSGQMKSGEAAANKKSLQTDRGDIPSKHNLPSSSTFLGQDVEQVIVNESHAAKRSAPQMPSESGIPTKRVSPTVIIVDCDDEKSSPAPRTPGNHQGSYITLTTPKSGLPSSRAMVGGRQDSKKTPPPEVKETRPQTPPITISNIRSVAPTEMKESKRRTPPITISNVRSTAAPEMNEHKRQTPPITISDVRSGGVFMPPPSRGPREAKKDSNTIIIIDDKDGDALSARPRSSPASSSNMEVKTSKPMTPPITNPKSNREPPPPAPPPSSINKTVQLQGGKQGSAVLVNKVQMQQQPSPIIVTGGNQPLSVPVNGNQSIMLTFPVTMGSSGIMLATPVNIADNQISGINQNSRVSIGKNTRLVTNTATTPRAVNPNFSSVAMTPVLGQTNRLPVTAPPRVSNPVAINVNQSSNINSALKNSTLPKVNGGTLKAVPVTAPGNQPIPLFVDANSGLILTGSAVPSKDNVSSGIGNATVVTVNGNVMTGNVAPVALGGKLAFGNIAPVNGLYIGNNSPVALAGNANNFNSNGTLNLNNSTILTLNGGLGIGNSGSVTAPITNIASVNANRTLQVATSSASTIVVGANQQNSSIIAKKVGEQSGPPNQPGPEQPPAVVLERLFKCSDCDEKFNSLENLTTHRAVHRPLDRPAGARADELASKNTSGNGGLPGTDDDAPTILYTTQGDDGSTVYVVTV